MSDEQLESTYARTLIAISNDLNLKIIPMLLTSGAALLVLSGLKTRPMAFAFIFTLGIWGYVLSNQYLFTMLMAEELNNPLFNILYSFSYISIGLTITSLLSYPLARHEWHLTKKQVRTEAAAYLIVGSLILAPITWFTLTSLRTAKLPTAAAQIILAGLAAWIVWHIFGAWVTARTLSASYIKKGPPHEKYILVKMRSEPFRIPEIDAYELLRMAMLPLLFSYAVANFLLEPFTFVEGLEKAGLTAKITLYLLPTLALFVAPLKWLFRALNIKRFDKHMGTLEFPKVPFYLEEFVGLGALFAFTKVSYDAATKSGNAWLAIYISYLALWTLLPSVLIATILYVKFSLRRHFETVLKQINYVEIDSLRDLGITK